MEWGDEEADPREFIKGFRTDLFDDEVYVFTPKGEVKTLPAGSTPIDFAYSVHTDVGHRTVGAKVNGRIVPLHYTLHSGDFVEILTSKGGRGPSRDWMALARSTRARNKIRQWFSRETREDTEHKGREALEQALKAQKLPYRKIAGSAVLAQVIRETGFKKAEDFYIALGSGKLPVSQIVKKVLARLKTAEVAEEEIVPLKPKPQTTASTDLGITVQGAEGVLVRLAKCCTPVPSDEIVGYISLGKGITIHRKDCPNVKALMRNPERFTDVDWDGATHEELLRADRRRRVGPAAAARGRGPDVRRARREHRLLRRHGRGSARQELVHGRARRREVAAHAADLAAQRRSRLRRVPGHAVVGQVPSSFTALKRWRRSWASSARRFPRSGASSVRSPRPARTASSPRSGQGRVSARPGSSSAMASGASFVTVEVDDDRAAVCARLFADSPNVRVLHGDWHERAAPGGAVRPPVLRRRGLEAQPTGPDARRERAGARARRAWRQSSRWTTSRLSTCGPRMGRGGPTRFASSGSGNDALVATEVLTTPDSSAIVAVKR